MKLFTLAVAATVATGWAYGQTVYAQDLAGFNAVATDQQVYGFDDVEDATNIDMNHRAGMVFGQLFGSAPIVVEAATTFTPTGVFNDAPDLSKNVLIATSGKNVLSPGGRELGSGETIDRDGITIEFDAVQRYFGFDLLSQSADGFSFASITIYDAANQPLFSSSLPISNVNGQGGGAPAAADFWGIAFSGAVIKRVVISESDDDKQFPDANVGFDTIRYSAVPEPSSVVTLAGLGALALRRRRK